MAKILKFVKNKWLKKLNLNKNQKIISKKKSLNKKRKNKLLNIYKKQNKLEEILKDN